MTHEVPGQNGFKEFKLILPTLQAPIEGDFEAVYADYLSDPERFRVALQYRVQTDNPEILALFDEQFNDGTSTPDMSLKWVHIYYAMFDRAARREGVPPLLISERTANETKRLSNFRSIEALQKADDGEFINRLLADRDKRKQRDIEFSPEFAKFWQSVENDINGIREENKDYCKHEDIIDLYAVTTVQQLLQRQQDEFSLIERYEL